MTRRVAIVGAGITGLAAAYYLEKRAREAGRPLHCTIIETSAQPGGKIVTDREKNFLIEGGPDSFVTDKPWALQLCHDLGLGDQLIPSNQRDNKIYMLKRGQLVQFPAGLRLTIPTQVMPFLRSPLISWPGKLRMGLEYFLPARPADGDETVGQFIGRRFGREAVDIFGGPLMAGIFVSDPDKLSMRSSFPRFLDMEKKYGSLIRGARAMKKMKHPPRPGPAPAGGAMFNSLKGGMAQLVETLREQLRAEWLLDTRLRGLSREGTGWRLDLGDRAITVDDVILTIPAHGAASLLSAHHAALAAALAAIRFVSTATVSLAYLSSDVPADRPLDGFGVVIPENERRQIIACTWASTKFKHRAPSDTALLRAFVGGYRDEALAEQDEAALIEMVRDEFASLFGISAAPLLAKVYRWPKGNPQYDVGHLDRTEQMMQMAAELPGLHLAGSSYHGVGMPDCIKSALRAVDAVWAEDAPRR